ncbi:D-glycerate dehydrogenase [Candidatus Sumerlaeota bacterium]|nr:D-glycerate dehydrogenase [Candidatus Sumerlaeota bacterium]
MACAPVLVTRRIPEAGLQCLLDAGLEFDVFADDRSPSREEFLRIVPGRSGILALLHDRIDAEALDAAGPQLRCVSNFAVGYNNIDIEEATRRGVLVTNTPDVLTEATADLAWSLIMAAARRICEGDRMVRAGEFHGWEPMMLLGQDLVGKTLGIVGAGRIGSAVARRSRGWEMRVLYTDSSVNESLERDLGASRVDLDTLCSESDVISVHCPLMEETHHLFGADQFGRMKTTAVFVNTARGPIHDEAALAQALRDGVIAAAGLDVFEREPSVDPLLMELDNAVLLPHIGSATRPTRDRMAITAAENLIAALRGERPANLLNPEVIEGRP